MEFKAVKDLPAKVGNPRNSEGSFLRLKDGRIAFAYSRYKGDDFNDNAYCEIAVMYSEDGGETFGEERVIAKPDPEKTETNYMSVSLLRMNNGDAGLFYLIKHEGLWSEVVLQRSRDEMETFEPPVRCVPQPYKNYYVINNDRILRCASGRIIIPAALHMTTDNNYGAGVWYESRAKAEFYGSDDDGVTWRRLSDALSLPFASYSRSGLQEPGVIELPGGTLYGYFRTDLGRHYESVSIDGGFNWFTAQPSKFTGPCSPLLIKKNDYSGKYYAFWNPVPQVNSGRPGCVNNWTGNRNPLVMAVSSDGVRFSAPEIIEDSETVGYCYPAVYFLSESEALLSYCAGDSSIGDSCCLERTRIAKISLG